MPPPRVSMPIAVLALLALSCAGCRMQTASADVKAAPLQTCSASQDPASDFCALH